MTAAVTSSGFLDSGFHGGFTDTQSTVTSPMEYHHDVIHIQVPMETERKVPIFSGKLGQVPTIKRTFSLESIETKLSLLTCSMATHDVDETITTRLRRRKRGSISRKTVSAPAQGGPTTWVDLANQRRGRMDKMLRRQNVHANNDDLSNVRHVTKMEDMYDYLETDEVEGLTRTGYNKGLHCANLTKSNSVSNLAVPRARRRSTASAGGLRNAKTNSLDFGKLKQAARDIRDNRISRRISQASIRSASVMSVIRKLKSGVANSIATKSDEVNDIVDMSTDDDDDSVRVNVDDYVTKRESVAPTKVWQGEILEIDLKRELTGRVKKKIDDTTVALERVTGHGDLNLARTDSECKIEYPMYVHDDFCRRPKMPQRIRISPHLSKVIKEDIRQRMGRPRYHEIRTRDMDIWNSGQSLDRSHRNLKVFNWLHSLREEEFEDETQQELVDVPPKDGVLNPWECVHIESCDEPTIRPLYRKEF